MAHRGVSAYILLHHKYKPVCSRLTFKLNSVHCNSKFSMLVPIVNGIHGLLYCSCHCVMHAFTRLIRFIDH